MRPVLQTGFSLLEVIASLAILVVSLGSLYSVFSVALDRAEGASKRAAALAVLESAVAKHAARGGLFDESGQQDGYQWAIVVQPTNDDVSANRRWQLYDISATVTWRYRNRTESMHFDTRRIDASSERP